MRVLLTGSKGYIGSLAVPMLRAAGHQVTGLDIGLFDRCDFGEPPEETLDIGKDLRDLSVSDLHRFDAVVHLAALSNDPLGNLCASLTHDINYSASVRLARLAQAAGVERFVFSSSCSTYGAAGDDFLDETAALNPVTPYAQSKVLVEQEVSKLAGPRFIPTFLRNATAYGVSSRLRLDIVLNDLVASAFTAGRVYLKSDGTPWRPIVHIQDIIQAVLCVLDAPADAVRNQTFNVGATGENYRIRELAEIVAETVPDCRIEYAPGGGPDKRCYRVDCDKILRMLPSFQPQWTARKGARELYEAYRRIGLTYQQTQGSRYIRIARIQELLNGGLLDADLRWTSMHEAAEPGMFSSASRV